MSLDIAALNTAQREAVTTTEGPLLVLAGAGSGKTRVLTYRIGYILEEGLAEPYQILAITFTNKAAGEMRERLRALLPGGIRGMWVSTFHALCVRMLRRDAERLGYTRGFTIYDDDDQRRLIKEIYSELDISTQTFPVNMVRSRISAAKNDLVDARAYARLHSSSPVDKKVAAVYARYSERLLRADAMDFDDLLVNGYRLLAEHEDVRCGYQLRFRYVLVDEYQDTNRAQYEITRMIAEEYRNIMVVGDDDQSIYSWRGADIQIILNFEKEYADAHTVKLEQNYRSTKNILNAANGIIQNNVKRKAKRLFTDGAEGEKVEYYCASDERDEGRFIAGGIEKYHEQGRSYDDVAVFYRTNAQSRVLEDMFLRAGVPYRIVGGTRFFERAEIRDVMAYLKLIVNPADDISAKRIVNTPRRGIGKGTIEYIESLARVQGLTFEDALQLAISDEHLQSRARTALAKFDQVISDARHYTGELRDVVEMIIEKSGLVDALEAEHTDESASRVENIKEFLGVVQEFVDTHEDDEDDDEPAQEAEEAIDDSPEPSATASELLGSLMEWLALRSDLDSMTEGDEAVTMMTVHAAKGLEFPIVYLAGMEESIFPHGNSMNSPEEIEEERRLAYVAVTRARERLHITSAQHRSLFGMTQANPRSRFVGEIPASCLVTSGVGSRGFAGTGWEKRGDRHGIYGSGTSYEQSDTRISGRTYGAGGARRKPGKATEAPAVSKNASRTDEAFAVGDQIDHKIFGRGVVVGVKGDAIDIRFKKTGAVKKLLVGFAPIVKIR